jgi:hypothetical protein
MIRALFSSDAGWRAAPFGGAALVSLAAAWLIWTHFFTQDHWVFLLDHVNLAVHEAGHPIVGLLSGRLSVYGGTLFQLLFPVLFGYHFLRQRDSLGFAVAGIWTGESLMNVARYMRDARAQQLPLVGGGMHDWTEIFSRWGVLRHDVAIAAVTKLLGLGVIIVCCWWLWRRVLKLG